VHPAKISAAAAGSVETLEREMGTLILRVGNGRE